MSEQQAAKRGRIGGKGPPLLVVIPRPDSFTTLVAHEALIPDPQRWFRIMDRADLGDTGAMIDMFSDARDRDQHLDGVARKRANSMMGRPLIFRPADGLEDDKAALAVARKVRRILLFESFRFRSMLTHLMQGAVDGYSVAQLRWSVSARGEHVPHLVWVHANRFAFDRVTLELGFYTGRYRSHGSVEPLVDHPDAFVSHVPMTGRSDYPWRRGAMRSAIIPSFIKRNGLKSWMVLAERFGMPQPYAKVPPGEDADGKPDNSVIAEVESALKNLNRTWSMVVTNDIEIDSIEGSGNVNGDIHQRLISWADMTQSIGLLGQNLTTKVEGGSFAAAESHRFVADDLHLADAMELAETVTQQIVKPLCEYNWPGEPVPVFEISTAPKRAFLPEDVRDGTSSQDERRRTLGHEAKPDGTGADYAVTVQVPADLEPDAALVEEVVEEPSDELEAVAPETLPEVDPTAVTVEAGGFPLIGQITSLLQVTIAVANGELTAETAIALVTTSLPMTTAEAKAIFDTIDTASLAKPEEQDE